MSLASATAFMERLETDEEFFRIVEAAKDDPEARSTLLAEHGVDATPDEMKEAFLERFGAELTPEQLEAVSAGSGALIGGAIVGGVIGLALVAAVAAAYI